MPNIMSGYAETGLTTAKYVRRRSSDGAWWNTVEEDWEAYTAGNIAEYGIVATEVGSTGLYQANDPDESTPGDYFLIKAAGADLAVADIAQNVRWHEKNNAIVLAPSGIDKIFPESTVNGRQAISLILAALAGKLTAVLDPDTQVMTVTIYAANVTPDTARIVAETTPTGHRTSVTVTPPA